MNDHYLEVLVKRNSEQTIKKRRTALRLLLAALFAIAFLSAIPLFYLMTILTAIVYYFAVVKCNVEFEYFYMNGELDIAKVKNRSKRKEVRSIKDEMIRLIAPVDSEEAASYLQIKPIDCSAGEAGKNPYVIVYSGTNTLEKVIIEMDDALQAEFKRRLFDKVIENKNSN